MEQERVPIDELLPRLLDPTINPSAHPQPKTVSVRYHFGLPAQPPDRRWREDDQLPIHHAVWEHQEIRYTQTLLLSRIQPGELMPNGTIPEDTVILVQLTGMSLATEYTDAVASLQVDVDGQPFKLALDRGLVRAATHHPPLYLAALDVPAEGVDTSSGPRLQFRGHMPPGTSGAMTIKIPLRPLVGTESLNRLLDLEFDDEFRRVRRYWQSRIAADPQTPPPTLFHVTGVSVRGNVQPRDTRSGH
jgi:hypothetical protein